MRSETWNRSSALTPEENGIINTAVAATMERAGAVKFEFSLTDKQTIAFYEAIHEQVNVKIEEFLQERHRST